MSAALRSEITTVQREKIECVKENIESLRRFLIRSNIASPESSQEMASPSIMNSLALIVLVGRY